MAHSIVTPFIALALLSVAPTAAQAEGGPCTDDIAKLSRWLGTQVGLGAPVSEPDYGQRTGPSDTASQKTAGNTTATVGSSETDRSQSG